MQKKKNHSIKPIFVLIKQATLTIYLEKLFLQEWKLYNKLIICNGSLKHNSNGNGNEIYLMDH